MRKATLLIMGLVSFVLAACHSASATPEPLPPTNVPIQIPSPVSTLSPTRILKCPETLPIHKRLGQYVMVNTEQSFSLHLREQPRLSAHVLDEARPSEHLRILDGPICADDYVWWQVEILRSGHPTNEWTIGWAAEGNSQEQWLIPLPVATQPNLDCKPEETQWHCFDQVLSLEFKYPFPWGTIVKATQHAGECGGIGYFYSFDQLTAPQAAGFSTDFCVPRMGDFTSLFTRGFSASQKDNLPADGCRLVPQNTSWTSTCYAISERVVIYLLFPKPSAVCNFGPDPGGIGREPIGIVAIDAPATAEIDGFSFIQKKILSTAMLENLYKPLGGPTAPDKMLEEKCKDPAAVQESDRRLASVIEQLTTRTADSKTNENLRALDELARSIQDWSP